MSGLVALPGFGKAVHCQAAHIHQPTPVRFVWHHILPLTAGGKTELANIVQLCDNCHYTVHALMLILARNLGGTKPWGRHGTELQRTYASLGYDRAVALGTVSDIPDEGSIL